VLVPVSFFICAHNPLLDASHLPATYHGFERTGDHPPRGDYCASHKNWIRNLRFSIMNRPLSQ